MKIDYDKNAEALYIFLKMGDVEKTVTPHDKVLFDLDKNGEIIGIEILGVTKRHEEGYFEDRKINIPLSIKRS